MVSLKKHLEPEKDSSQPLLRVAQILLQGISEHVVDYDAECCARFRRSIQKLAEAFRKLSPPLSCWFWQARPQTRWTATISTSPLIFGSTKRSTKRSSRC